MDSRVTHEVPRVLFDISLLAGLARPNPPAASGLHRVTEQILNGLAISEYCELGLVTSGSPLNTLYAEKYIAGSRVLKGVSFEQPSWYSSLVSTAIEIAHFQRLKLHTFG